MAPHFSRDEFNGRLAATRDAVQQRGLGHTVEVTDQGARPLSSASLDFVVN